jgi:hypothetical protein
LFLRIVLSVESLRRDHQTLKLDATGMYVNHTTQSFRGQAVAGMSRLLDQQSRPSQSKACPLTTTKLQSVLGSKLAPEGGMIARLSYSLFRKRKTGWVGYREQI